MDPRERELLTGMGNCYEACGENFDRTVEMVAEARHRTVDDVKRTLQMIRERDATDPTYQKLRNRLPAEFPL